MPRGSSPCRTDRAFAMTVQPEHRAPPARLPRRTSEAEIGSAPGPSRPGPATFFEPYSTNHGVIDGYEVRDADGPERDP